MKQKQKQKVNFGLIVGVVVGILILGILCILLRRHKRTQQYNDKESVLGIGRSIIETIPIPYIYSPQGPYLLPLGPQTSLRGTLPSDKARAAVVAAQSTEQGIATSSQPASVENPSSSRELPLASVLGGGVGGDIPNPLSTSEVEGLRSQVENLRHMVQLFEEDRLEPPPQYIEGSQRARTLGFEGRQAGGARTYLVQKRSEEDSSTAR